MKEMQAHARKIRSDAAECLVLSNLVTEERRQLFGRIAEHLNSLALEIETEAKTTLIDEPSATPDQHVDLADAPAASPNHRRAARSWRLLPWLLLVAIIVIAGAVLWARNRTEFAFNMVAKAGSEYQASAHEFATLLSEERGQRKAFSDELNALIARLDHLAKDLDDLKSLRAGVSAAPSTKGGVSQEDPSPGTEAKPQPEEKMSSPAEISSSTSSAGPAAAQTTGSAPATTNPEGESADQVGTISTTRNEADPRKLTIGPAGCTHFRSFDPISGTYTTFDGRRRQCR